MISKSFRITKIMIREQLLDKRVLVLLIVMAVFFANMTLSIPSFCSAAHVRINPLFYPYINSYAPYQIVITSGIIFLFSSAPFFNEQQSFVLIRSGKTSWLLGCIWYILAASALYFLVVMVLPAIFVAPVATFSTDGWGRAIQTLIKTTATGEFGIFVPFPSIENAKISAIYSPLSAFAFSFVLQWLIGSFLGLLLFFVNLASKRRPGVFIAMCLVVFDLVIVNALPESVYRFSPVSFGRLSVIDVMGNSPNLPSVLWCFVFLGVGISLFFTLIMLQGRSKKTSLS